MRGKKPENHGDGTVVVSERPNFLRKKKWTAGLAIVILALIIGYAALKDHQKKANTVATANICVASPNNKILEDAAKNFNVKDRYQLQKDVVKIQNLPNYQQDPNCLYVLTRFYINNGDAANAQKYVDELAQIYNAKVKLDRTLGYQTLSITTLKSIISYMKKNTTQTQNNAHAFGNPQ